MLFFLALSLSLSLSFSPHGADTTVPSALHLFNKDLLCSRTLIQNTHTHTSRLPLVADRGEKRKKKKRKKTVRDVELETLAASLCQLALLTGERRESRRESAGTQRWECQLRPPLPPCGTLGRADSSSATIINLSHTRVFLLL